MPVKHAVKRNSLSSKWGVWSTDTDAPSPVENLVAEFKTSEAAESYCVRIEAGELHDAVMASLTEKKPKANTGGGRFGKLFKRGQAAETADSGAEKPVSNPVIEIQAPARQQAEQPADAPVTAEAQSVENPAPVKRADAPSRFQVINQPAPSPLEAPVEAEAAAPQVDPIDRKLAREAAMAAALNELKEMEKAKAEAMSAVEPAAMPEATVEAAEPEEVEQVKPEPIAEPVANVIEPVMAEAEASIEISAEEAPQAIPAEPVAMAEEPAVEAEEPQQVAAETERQPKVEQVTMSEPTASPAVTVSEAESAPAPVQEDMPRWQEPAPAPVASQPEVEKPRRQEAPATPVAAKPQASGRREDGLLVDWTFSPPPDVTPAELKKGAGNGVYANGKMAAAKNAIDPEWSRQAEQNAVPAATTQNDEGISHDPDTGRVTVDICVSKALKDSSQGDPRVSDKKYNSIASKEYTEVSKAFATGNNPEHLQEELTHLAAVCLAWADALKKRMSAESAKSESRAA